MAIAMEKAQTAAAVIHSAEIVEYLYRPRQRDESLKGTEPEKPRFGFVLNDLSFGDYELVDTVSLAHANINLLDEAQVPRPVDDDDIVTVGPVLSPHSRRAFQLNDDLEAEAVRRRFVEPVAIPERRFGVHLSDDFALRFRYATSWSSVEAGDKGPERTDSSFPIVFVSIVAGTALALVAYFGFLDIW